MTATHSFARYDAILNHQKPDKMPVYIPTVACSVASEILGKKVNTGSDSLHFAEELSWLSGEAAHDDFVETYHENIITLGRKLGIDILREGWRSSARPQKKIDDYTLLFSLENGAHIIKRFYPEEQSYGVIENTAQFRSVEELLENLKTQMKTSVEVSDNYLKQKYDSQIRLKKRASPYFPLIAAAPGVGISMYDPLWLELIALEPDFLAEFFMHATETALKEIQFLHKQGFSFLNGGGDLASNQGPVYSPHAFHKIFVPCYKKISNECNKYDMKYCYRTDGNIWALSDYMFGEAGIQAYGEVDRSASMTVGVIRKRYPQLLILGNNSSATLHDGTEMEVREETRAALEESGGYNYIPGPSNAIVHGTPVRNIFAMLEEIDRFKP